MRQPTWTTKTIILLPLIGAISCIALGAFAQTPNSGPHLPSGPATAIAQELWPKGASGCEYASLTMKIDNGMVALNPASAVPDFGNTRITTSQRGMVLTVGKPGCLIRVRIEAVVDDSFDEHRR